MNIGTPLGQYVGMSLDNIWRQHMATTLQAQAPTTSGNITVEPIENGWIVHISGKRYLADTPEKITELIVAHTVRERVTR